MCVECCLLFRFLGIGGGYPPDRPTTDLVGMELRAPLTPLDLAIAAKLTSEQPCNTMDTADIADRDRHDLHQHPGE